MIGKNFFSAFLASFRHAPFYLYDNIANYFTYRQKHMIYPYDIKFGFDGTNRETCACERAVIAVSQANVSATA
jgi:hypothetical protein